MIEEHDAKVYGKEPPGTPPMTVPHLDTRFINGQKTLLFGPFASIGPKFLKYGSNLDLFKSVKPSNITTLLSAAAKNLPLLKYSFDQMYIIANLHRVLLDRKYVSGSCNLLLSLKFGQMNI